MAYKWHCCPKHTFFSRFLAGSCVVYYNFFQSSSHYNTSRIHTTSWFQTYKPEDFGYNSVLESSGTVHRRGVEEKEFLSNLNRKIFPPSLFQYIFPNHEVMNKKKDLMIEIYKNSVFLCVLHRLLEFAAPRNSTRQPLYFHLAFNTFFKKFTSLITRVTYPLIFQPC